MKEESAIPGGLGKNLPASQRRLVALLRQCSNALLMSVLLLLVCGLAWNYSTHRYLKGFADAIFPLDGSPQEKTEGLLKWLRDGPHRASAPRAGLLSFSDRDAVDIVQNARLLRICGSASNAFINLADVADLRTRRLLLLTRFGGTMHVVAEVQWGERWVVVDPTFARVLEDRSGRALTKEELRDPEVFRDAISRIPGYSPTYTFERTTHLHLERLPLLGVPLRRTLDRVWPGWEEAVDWGYVPENPSLWPILASLPLLLLGSLIRLIVERYRSADSTNYADYPLTQSAKSVEDRSA